MIIRHVKPLTANTLAIITPYKEQMIRVREMIQDNISPLIEVNTVDAFQGQEKDIIIFSCVRSTDLYGESKGIGFLKDTRRLNVALTRAKYALYTVGRSVVLKTNTIWNNYLCHMNDQKKVKVLSNDDDALDTLGQIPIHSKLRVDQLDISPFDVKQSTRNQDTLGKRMILENTDNQADHSCALNEKTLDISNAIQQLKSNKMNIEYDSHQSNSSLMLLQDQSKPKKIEKPHSQDKHSEKKPKVVEDRQDIDSKGPKTLRDLIKPPPAAKKSKSKTKSNIFNLAKEVENFNFEDELNDS